MNIEEKARETFSPLSKVDLSSEDKMDILQNLRNEMSSKKPRRTFNLGVMPRIASAGVAVAIVVGGVGFVIHSGHFAPSVTNYVTTGANESDWGGNQVVQASSLPSAVVQFVDRAGKRVGDSHPKIVYVKTGIDDPTQKPMYYIHITGDFNYGSHHAKELPMIVLADGTGGSFIDSQDNAFNLIQLK